jgi:hypothetical protein
VRIVVDFEDRRSQLVPLLFTPRKRGEVHVLITGVSSGGVAVNHREPDHGTESALPRESGQSREDVGIRRERSGVGAGRFLVVMNEKLERLGNARRAQMPLAGVLIRRAREWLAAERQQIAAAIEVPENCVPVSLRPRGAVGQHEQIRVGRSQSRPEMIRVGKIGIRPNRAKLGFCGRGRVGGWKSGLPENDGFREA